MSERFTLPAFRLFDAPRPAADLGGWLAVVGEFTQVVGHTLFGDLFLRDPKDGRYAILLPMWGRMWALRFTDLEPLETVYLQRPRILEKFLRAPDAHARCDPG